MTGLQEHGAIALAMLDEALRLDSGDGPYYTAAAQVHATMALVVMVREVRDRLAEQLPLLREIGDQLDTIPRREPVIACEVVDEAPADPLWDSPRYKAAALLERTGVGDEGEQRELTIARLVLGSSPKYSPDYSADVAVHALHAARDAGGGNKVKAVEAAIATLGIELDAS